MLLAALTCNTVAADCSAILLEGHRCRRPFIAIGGPATAVQHEVPPPAAVPACMAAKIAAFSSNEASADTAGTSWPAAAPSTAVASAATAAVLPGYAACSQLRMLQRPCSRGLHHQRRSCSCGAVEICRRHSVPCAVFSPDHVSRLCWARPNPHLLPPPAKPAAPPPPP